MNLKSCFYNNVFTILFPTTVKYDRSKKKKKKETILEMMRNRETSYRYYIIDGSMNDDEKLLLSTSKSCMAGTEWHYKVIDKVRW